MMKKEKTTKKGYGILILAAVILVISLFSYVPVSLGFADGFLLAAGQVGGLAAGAVYLLFFNREKRPQGASETPSLKRSRRTPSDGAREETMLPSLKNTLSGVGYTACWVCFFVLLTFPVQNILAKWGLASLNECAHYQNFWEMILYVCILPPVCFEVLHRLIVLPALQQRFEKRWQTVLLSALVYTFSAPQIGNVLARFALGALLALLFLRTRSFLACFCGALVAQSVFFAAGYLQILGFAGAEGYSFVQCLGMGLSFAAPGAVILYFNEKIATKKKIRLAEVLTLLCCAVFAFALGMALWLE